MVRGLASAMTELSFSEFRFKCIEERPRSIGPLTKNGIFTPCVYSIPKVEQYKCPLRMEINRLKVENKQLKEQLSFFLGSSNIQNDSTELYYAKKVFTQCDKQDIDFSMDFFFFTLTFDPDKFGHDNDPEDEEDYILIVLHKLLKGKERYNVESIYLCFEKTKAGVIHAHGVCISSPAYLKVVKHYLKTCFTNNPRNIKAVQYEPAKKRCIEYINKDADYKKWFHSISFPGINTDFGLDFMD